MSMTKQVYDNVMTSSNAKRRAAGCMTAAIAFHFAGYELARAATVSIFTSDSTISSDSMTSDRLGGFGPRTAVMLPLAVFCVSPCSVFLLWTYSYNLERLGPKQTLTRSTGIASLAMVAAVLALHSLQLTQDVISTRKEYTTDYMIWSNRLTHFYQLVIFLLIVFQNSNVQLLFTQHWSFIGSIFTPVEASTWFAPIAGVGSITSTLAAASVSIFLRNISLFSLLLVAATLIAVSGHFAKLAYDISNRNGFDPSSSLKDRSNHNGMYRNMPLIEKAKTLFRRVPIMKLLFMEVIISQSVSSMINFSFMVNVKNTITDNHDRASWTGNCYAWINGISGALQFFVLPLVSRYIPSNIIWLFMPLCMLPLTLFPLLSNRGTNLNWITISYSTMKILEYSIRSMISEMIYVEMDFESRYVGKEIINLLANRLGKSVIAASLALASYILGRDNEVLSTSFFVCCHSFSWLWLFISLRLSVFKPSVHQSIGMGKVTSNS